MISVGIATNSLETIMTSNTKRKANYPVNKYLEGNYTPVNEERVVQFEDMKVIGEIPWFNRARIVVKLPRDLLIFCPPTLTIPL